MVPIASIGINGEAPAAEPMGTRENGILAIKHFARRSQSEAYQQSVGVIILTCMGKRLCYIEVHDRAVAIRRPPSLFKPPCSGRAVTIFDFIQVIGIIIGAWIGFKWGRGSFGLFGALGGGGLGLVVGYFVGQVPWYLAWVVFEIALRSASKERLRKRLQTEHFIAHLLIAELIVRGEPVDSFWPYIMSLLQADSFYERYHGWENLNIWFPRIAKEIEGFDPSVSVERCRKHLVEITNVEPCAEPLSFDPERDSKIGLRKNNPFDLNQR